MFTKTAVKLVKIAMGDFWRNGLIDKLKNSGSILVKSDTLAVIRDSFPKARLHFLVLPFDEGLDNIHDLSTDTMDLLDEFELLATNIIELSGNREENFKIGFHAIPSMRRLHLHVVSKDFDSPCLKNKKHWNSFNTDFLVPISKVRSDLNSLGFVQKMSDEEGKNLLNTPLKCNTCGYKPKHIPDLKKHLISHASDYVPAAKP